MCWGAAGLQALRRPVGGAPPGTPVLQQGLPAASVAGGSRTPAFKAVSPMPPSRK